MSEYLDNYGNTVVASSEYSRKEQSPVILNVSGIFDVSGRFDETDCWLFNIYPYGRNGNFRGKNNQIRYIEFDGPQNGYKSSYGQIHTPMDKAAIWRLDHKDRTFARIFYIALICDMKSKGFTFVRHNIVNGVLVCH